MTDAFWQIAYYHFVIQLRANKIKEGRATSFTYMVNDKKRLIGKIAAKVPEGYKESAFMASSFTGQPQEHRADQFVRVYREVKRFTRS